MLLRGYVILSFLGFLGVDAAYEYLRQISQTTILGYIALVFVAFPLARALLREGLISLFGKRWEGINMRKVLIIGGLVVFLAYSGLSGASTSPSANYKMVAVKQGDTLWHIAANHINSGEDVRELIFAIKKVNGLGNNAEIFPGQELKIPDRKPAPTKIASIF